MKKNINFPEIFQLKNERKLSVNFSVNFSYLKFKKQNKFFQGIFTIENENKEHNFPGYFID